MRKWGFCDVERAIEREREREREKGVCYREKEGNRDSERGRR